MKLFIEWNRTLVLRDASRHNLIYDVDLRKIPEDAGLYIFGRRWGAGFEALYVGKAFNVRARVKSQLNNLRLMQHLRNAKTGSRVLLVSQIKTKPGQRLEKCLVLIERAMIRYFLSEGYDLVNKQGTRIRRHEVLSSGKHPKRFVPNIMFVERGPDE
jgi:hypothetical protein